MMHRRIVMQNVDFDNATAGRIGGKKSHLQRIGVLVLLLVFTVMVTSIVGERSAYAAKDELRLTGIVKEIDPKTGIVFVDVQSESCPGMRRFYAEKTGAMDRYVDLTITFFIDSSTCRDASVHTILVSWGINNEDR